MENTKWRAGRAGGPCCQRKNVNFPRADELHRRAGQQTALQNGPVGCTLRQAGGLHIKLGCGKGRVGGLPFSAARSALFRSPPDRLFVQPALLSSVQYDSLPKVHVFHLETRPSSPPVDMAQAANGPDFGRAAEVERAGRKRYFLWLDFTETLRDTRRSWRKL